MIYLAVLLGLSLALNLQQHYSKKKQKRSLSVDAKELLHDLTNGGAIVKVTVIDPEGIMIYQGIR